MTVKKTVILCLAVLLTLSLFAGCACAKEEVVYANLDSTGNVEGVYVVNIFDTPEKITITDYGEYTAVKNLISSEPIVKSGDDKYTVEFGPGKLYYQGTMANNLPWLFNISYELAGKEISPEELAGKAGHVVIHIRISQNPEGDEFFFRNYALNATVLLDANTCQNIVADGATIANNGAKKQLTYTILPNRDTDLTIELDAVAFEMDEISINGVRLSMDIDSDSVDMSQIDDLKDAVKKLTDASDALSVGTSQLYSGVAGMPDSVSQLKNAADGLYAILQQQGDTQALPYAQALVSGLGTLQASAPTLVSGSRTLMSGAAEIANGLAKLKTETLDMEDKITDKINEVLDPISISGEALQSFASKKNTNVERVQFVMHTAAVEIPEEPVPVEPKKELNFFERILALFGLA